MTTFHPKTTLSFVDPPVILSKRESENFNEWLGKRLYLSTMMEEYMPNCKILAPEVTRLDITHRISRN